MASLYYSSESSDSDSGIDRKSLDLSYLMLDADSLASYLKNSVQEQHSAFKHRNPESASSKHKASDDVTSNEELLKLQQQMASLSTEAMGQNFFKESNPGTSSQGSPSLTSRSASRPSALSSVLHSGNKDVELDSKPLVKDGITEKLYLNHNILLTVPFEIVLFHKLKTLDLSNNNLSHINDFILHLPELQSLYLKNNSLDNNSIPKEMSVLSKLREINLSGNQLTMIPPQLYEVSSLRYLYLGSNCITEIRPEIKALQNLQVLHVGGNSLTTVPEELGALSNLCALVLCNNRLRRLPRAISCLTGLRSLLLHNNNLCCLPVEIVKLRGLNELSLRDNPLVTRFVNSCAKELIFTPPSLKELAARSVQLKRIPYSAADLPVHLHQYLLSGHKCVNPKCKGLYFSSCVEHIKFVDFCGMYRVPLMHYLCSSRCTSQTPSAYYSRRLSSSDSEDDATANTTMRRVLLG
ncbi:Leucine-rich repeat [Trinorchestia longiramus]|nr:Leucine-rich repeat [Trinorchestia longiramus]